jgi:hypothetical protein
VRPLMEYSLTRNFPQARFTGLMLSSVNIGRRAHWPEGNS